ncbi:MAG: succinate dehydrogenase/fumarate reductase iron-sulfur subunit [Leptospirales bacterium]
MSEDKKDIYFRVFRFNPEVDDKSYYDEYKITVEKGITILRAINYIKDHIDPKLSYRFYCQAGICGSCAVKVNGVSKLACTTQVWDELERCKEPNVITIDPLSNLNVMRDMVVDYNPVVEKLKKYKSWVTPDISKENLGKAECVISEKDFQVINQATDCILCAACFSECTIMEVSPEFISPLVLLKSFRMNKDERDTQQVARLNILNADHGMWDCTHCYKCVEVCVKNIPIMDAISGVRNDAIQRNMKNTEGYRHGVAFEQDILSKGRLNEGMLPVKTKGLLRSISLIPMGIKMMMKGRMPGLFAHKIPGIKNVRRMYKKVSELKKK